MGPLHVQFDLWPNCSSARWSSSSSTLTHAQTSIPRHIPIGHELSEEMGTWWITTMTASEPARSFVSPFSRVVEEEKLGRGRGRKGRRKEVRKCYISQTFHSYWHHYAWLDGGRKHLRIERKDICCSDFFSSSRLLILLMVKYSLKKGSEELKGMSNNTKNSDYYRL